MLTPDSYATFMFYGALLTPGIIFAGVRAHFRGFRAGDESVAIRLLHATVVSVVFAATYVAGLWAISASLWTDPVLFVKVNGPFLAMLFVLLAVVVPAALSWLIYGAPPFTGRLRRVLIKLRPRLTESRYSSVPNAWDFATTTSRAEWVRVRMPDGKWVGGKFTTDSFFSTYPEPRDIYLSEQYELSKDGVFGSQVAHSVGIWISVPDGSVVEFLKEEEREEGADVEQ